MTNSMKKVRIKSEFITLGQMLKLCDCIDSGGSAKIFLLETAVTVNGVEENRRGRKLYVGDTIHVEGFGSFQIE